MPSEPPLLLVDVGNSRLKFGRADFQGRIEAACAVEPDGDWSAVDALLAGTAPSAARVWASSVRRSSLDRLLAWTAGRGVPAEQVQVATCVDFQPLLPLRVDQPDRVGVDRLCAALAAAVQAAGRPALAIDCGTALTVNVVSAKGEFLGGAIAPGLRTSARSLWTATDQLPEVPLPEDAPPGPIGPNTIAAIQAGIFWQAVGLVREIHRAAAADPHVGGEPLWFLTGGGGRTLAAALGAADRFRPHLNLEGLARAAAGPGGPTLGEDGRSPNET